MEKAAGDGIVEYDELPAWVAPPPRRLPRTLPAGTDARHLEGLCSPFLLWWTALFSLGGINITTDHWGPHATDKRQPWRPCIQTQALLAHLEAVCIHRKRCSRRVYPCSIEFWLPSYTASVRSSTSNNVEGSFWHQVTIHMFLIDIG